MASECAVTDRSISEFTGVKKLGDDRMEEEKHEPEDVSVADEMNKEEEHKQVSSSSEPALETNEGKPNDVEKFTSKEPVNTAFKQEDLKAAEVAQTSENESKPESSNDKAEIELVKSEDSKDDVHELMPSEVPVVVFPDASKIPEEIDVDGTLTSVSVPVKNLEAESGSPDERKPEESGETKADLELIKSEDTKGEVHDLVPAEISVVDSEAPEENNADSITKETKEHVGLSMSEDSKEEVHELVPTEVSINAEAPEKSDADSSTRAIVEVPVKDFDVEYSSPEEQKAEVGAESEVKELVKSGYSEDEGQELVSEEVPTDISEAVKKNDVHSSVPTSVEVPLKDLEVESGSPEEQKIEESVENKVDIELIESGELKDEGHDLVFAEVPTNTSEAPEEDDVDLSAPTSTLVPVKNVEFESISPGEQKPEEGAETKISIELTEPGDSKVEDQELVSVEVPASTSEVPKINDVDLSTPTSTKVPVNDLEIESGSPDERKPEEGPETKVNIELIESGDSKNEGQEPVSADVYTNNSEELEKNDVDSSNTTRIEVPVQDLEVESGSPTEQKLEESAETKVNTEFIKSGESKDKVQDLFSGEVTTRSSEASEINDAELSTPTSTEVHVKDLEVDSSSIEEWKLEESAETKVVVDLIESGDSKDEGQESISSKVSTTSEWPENNNVNSSSSISIEVPAKDVEVESGSSEEQKIEETSETEVNIKLIESGDSKVEGQESVSAEVPASTSERPEENTTDLNTPTGIEVPAKDVEVESGSSDEQKIEESAETKVNTDFINSGKSKDEGQASGEVPTSSYQAPEINNAHLSIPTSTEVPVKNLEVESGSPEEQKPEEGAETKVNIKLIESVDSKVEGQENNAVLSTPTGLEIPVKDLEVESMSVEENKFEGSAEIKVNTDFIKSGESKDEEQDLVSGEVPTNTSEAPEINAVDLSAPTSTEVPVKDLEVESGSPEEQKPEINIELMESSDSKVEGQEFVSAHVLGNTSNVPEKEDVELSTNSTEVTPKDLDVQSGPEEQKLVESAKTNVDRNSTDEGQESVFAEVPTNASEECEHNNVDLTSRLSTEVPVKDLEVDSGSAEEQNPKVSAETKEPSSDVITIDGGGEVAVSPYYEDKEVVDKEDEGLKEEVMQTIIEEDQAHVEDKVSEAVAVKKDDEIVEDGIEGSTVLDVVPPVAEVFPGEVVEERKDEASESDNTDSTRKVSEVSLAGGNVLDKDVNVVAIERNLAETSIDSTVGGVFTEQAKIPENVAVEPLELKFGELNVSPEASEVPSVGEGVSAGDEKSEGSKSGEPKDETSEADNTDITPKVSEVSLAGGNVLEKDVNVEAIGRDLAEPSIDFTAGGVSTGQAKIPENVEGEPLELKFEELDVSREVPSVAERFSAVDEKSETSKGEERKDETSKVENTDTAANVPEVSSAVGNVLEKDVNAAEAIERDLAETFIDSTVGRISTEQAKIPENVEVKPLELKFEELNPEASQVPSAGERVFAGDEKSETSKGETKDIATSDESLAHLVEETENESSKPEAEALVEQFPETVKEIIASESYNVKKDETSRDISLEEKSKVKVEGVIENVPEHEELVVEKGGEKPKDEEQIISSDTRDVKLIKESTKRDSNIFAKVKRSIIKAKKAILGKSPGPRTISSESKDENI